MRGDDVRLTGNDSIGVGLGQILSGRVALGNGALESESREGSEDERVTHCELFVE